MPVPLLVGEGAIDDAVFAADGSGEAAVDDVPSCLPALLIGICVASDAGAGASLTGAGNVGDSVEEKAPKPFELAVGRSAKPDTLEARLEVVPGVPNGSDAEDSFLASDAKLARTVCGLLGTAAAVAGLCDKACGVGGIRARVETAPRPNPIGVFPSERLVSLVAVEGVTGVLTEAAVATKPVEAAAICVTAGPESMPRLLLTGAGAVWLADAAGRLGGSVSVGAGAFASKLPSASEAEGMAPVHRLVLAPMTNDAASVRDGASSMPANFRAFDLAVVLCGVTGTRKGAGSAEVPLALLQLSAA